MPLSPFRCLFPAWFPLSQGWVRCQMLIDDCKLIVYNLCMIKTFANAETESFFNSGKSRRLQKEIWKRASMRLQQIDAAVDIFDLRMPPSNMLERLSGDRIGQWSIRINKRFRVCFRFENGNAYDVEIVDYH